MASHFPLCGWQASRRASARIRRVVWICISTILMQSAPRMKDHERRLLSWRAWRALAFWRETGLAAFRSHPAKNPAPTFSTTCAKRHPNPQTRPSSMEAERTGPHAPANTHMNNPNEPRTPTEAQINANRENAKKSTGPRTAEGKSASSRNRSATACAPTNISSSTRIPKSSFSSSTTTWTASSPSAPAKRTWSCASPPTSAASTVSSPTAREARPDIISIPMQIEKVYEPQRFEPHWAQWWIDSGVFHASQKALPRVFSLVIPPPNVTGSLHIGHMLEHAEIDVTIRWHRMRGDNTLWLPGTDHAGIATQMVVERKLAEEGLDRRTIGRDTFIERVWEWKAQYGDQIKRQMIRLGASCDWSRERFTLDPGLSRAVREVFV